MSQKKLFYVILICILSFCYVKAIAIDIIPRPAYVQELPGYFLISRETAIVNSGSLFNESNYLKDVFKKEFNLNPFTNGKAHANNSIYMVLKSHGEKVSDTVEVLQPSTFVDRVDP